MSHYISSFLIEPVVRQARRFSRPSFGGIEPANHSDELATAATAADEQLPNPRPSLNIESSGETVVEDAEVIPPISLDGLDEGRLRDWRAQDDYIERLRLVELENLEPAVPARQYRLEPISDGSYNLQHGLSSSFRSDTSSLTDSSQSMLDTSALTGGQSQSSMARNDVHREESRRLRIGNRVLPEDDGMGHMRRCILAIQRTDSSSEVKARLVHDLMTEKHNALQLNPHDRAHSPISVQSSDRPFTPSSPKSTDSLRRTVSPPTSSSSAGDSANPFHLAAEDLKPTYYQKPSQIIKEADQERRSSESSEEVKALGCAHYKRNIKLQCSACNRWYTCRFCHDAVEDHMLNRRETKNMLCMLCGCAQPASEECALCSERGAWYYCDVCKLWDDDPQKSIYHCNDCGICRVGQGLGKDFFHCKVLDDVHTFGQANVLTRMYRPAVSACPSASEIRIAVLNVLLTATVPFAVNTCSPLPKRLSSCAAATASTIDATTSI